MADGAPHRFRFFVDETGEVGARVTVPDGDRAHLRVLRASTGTRVEIVDGSGALWEGEVDEDGAVRLLQPIPVSGKQLVQIELVAGALVGGRFDELVDGVVQAGVTRVIPYAASRRDLERLAARRGRLERICRSAAKQAKRLLVPTIGDPVDDEGLLALPPGIVLDAAADATIDAAFELVGGRAPGSMIRLLVGPADGLSEQLLAALDDRGWTRARLGPTVLRSELAAAVAVAHAAMHAPSA